jgi:glycosyltransferase involved in cell wall biosynthesis
MGIHDGGMATLPGAELAVQLAAQERLWLRDRAYSNIDLGLALSAADAVWLGYRDHPFSSGVLWEAAQAGVPVLGCNRGLIAWEIRSQGLGETADIQDIESVVTALNRLLFDEKQRKCWRDNQLRAGMEHTRERFGEAVAEMLEDLHNKTRENYPKRLL